MFRICIFLSILTTNTYYMCEGASNYFQHHKNSTVHPFLINFLDPPLMVMAICILYVVRSRLVVFFFCKIVIGISVNPKLNF